MPGFGLGVRQVAERRRLVAIVTPSPAITFDPIVTRSGQQYQFTARRTTNLTQAESRSVTLAPSTSYAPSANSAELSGLSGTANFAANSATAVVAITVPATVQPE